MEPRDASLLILAALFGLAADQSTGVHLPADWVPRVRRDGGDVLVRVLK